LLKMEKKRIVIIAVLRGRLKMFSKR
jgi:hypothetical protein